MAKRIEKQEEIEATEVGQAEGPTEEEIQARIEEAVLKAREEDKAARKQAEKEKRARERRERGEDEEEDPREIIAAAEARAAKAEQEAAILKRDSVLSKIENRLNSYLFTNYKEFMGNSIDIMAHIRGALSAAANETDQAIMRLIESHTKEFIERVKNAKGAHGAPAGGTRGKLPSSAIGAPSPIEERRTATPGVGSSRPFSTINWHG